MRIRLRRRFRLRQERIEQRGHLRALARILRGSVPKWSELWPGLLEAWLVLTSVKYHGNLYILIPLNQRLALTRPGLLEAWLVLTSVKYHGHLYILIPLNQRLALNRLRATGPRLRATGPWTCNSEAPSSSPALIASWICSRWFRVQNSRPHL